ncbi:MAG TPA: 4-hydroxy-3-methylbut-2-enyl diphosphate reductase [Candidatus Paceibacterota bacterium]|nr:4-hydroxy-3-methylbut-2-enyl diphosphate reductase [Verrucomicrobiota bacterium]HOX03008.1 4-hydroxy-3-methylbut-2-enyl diphosphate reductase [Verrucomicrobiota bacterium]HRZ45855.1 4-hydroxy-3-methylbut-2-enyl diphosphate reductase [Candidatus Paceibacterota bacterium]HRZ93860.1 4-hydroxy-3-methylbut-2-enyl diphosphate reductase [Candidatus Paceibacterota bacterium]
MNVIRARYLGMCFGVRDAIRLALQLPADPPVTILGDLVHNEFVLDRLRHRGIRSASTLEAVATPVVMITAHGASERVLCRARQGGFEVLEATCPLVRFAHRAAQELVRQGFRLLIVGQADHVEVRGITEDIESCDVILDAEDVERLEEHPRWGVISQTTQPVDRVLDRIERLRQRFPGSEVRWIDTVCRPTRQRQLAALELARRADVVIVAGGRHSNNTRELAATCRRWCPRVHAVQTADDLDPAWLEGASTVGLTAGTSTPDEIIDGVEARLRRLARADSPARMAALAR